MRRKLRTDSDALMREIARYLTAVDTFRAELREPTWLPELAPGGAAAADRSSPRPTAPRASRTSRT
jgi:hypothetical protein